MRITHSIGRPIRALLWGLLIALMAAPSFGRPGDRIDRYPLLVTNRNGKLTGPSLVMEESGRFVAVWASDEGQDTHVLFQRFAANGTPIGTEVTVDTRPDLSGDDVMMRADAALAADGSFAVVWQVCDFPCSGAVLYARRYTANGEPIGDKVLVTDERSFLVGAWSVAGAADGRFGIAWAGTGGDNIDGEPDVFARLFDAAVVPRSPPFPVVSEPTLERLVFGDVAMSATGDFLVAWADNTLSDSQQLVLGRRFDANGSALGDTFTLASRSATTPKIFGPALAMRSTGQFVLVLTKAISTPEAGLVPAGVYGRRFDAEGLPLGAEFRISAETGGGWKGVDSNDAGDFVVTWEDRGLHTRLYRASGSAATSDQRYNELSQGSVALDRVGNFAVGFARGYTADTNGFSGSRTMHVQRFAGYTDTRPSCARFVATVVGNDSANTLHGGPGNDIIVANGGNDTIFAWAGDDVMCGGNGDDVLYGGNGKDHLVGGAGDDLLDGGSSVDYCNGESHTNADTAVSCELKDNVP